MGIQVLSDSDELIVICEISFLPTMYQNKLKRSVYSLFNVGSAVGGLLNMLVRICELLSYKIATQQMFKHIGESVYYNIKNNHLKFSQLDWMCKKAGQKEKRYNA